MSVRVMMAAFLAAALIEGGGVARAVETANPAWFYTPSNNGFANAGDNALSSVQLLSRFAQTDATIPVVWQSAPLLGASDVEVAAPFGRNLAVEFGARSGNAFDFGSDGLFASPAGWQAFSQSGSEAHVQSAIGLGNGLALNLGESFGESDSMLPAIGPAWMQAPLGGGNRLMGTAESGFAGLNWNATPWASLGLLARQASAQAPGPGANFSPARVSSQTLGASGKVSFGNGWVTSISYNQGVTQLDLRPAGNLLATDSAQRSRSYGMAIAKHGLFGDDALGLEVSRPQPSSLDGVDLGDSTTADPFDGFISAATRPILAGSTQETDVQLGYVTTFLDGALALQANAGYQMNTAGQSGNNGVAVLSRAKINF